MAAKFIDVIVLYAAHACHSMQREEQPEEGQVLGSKLM
jgi:hypothetical protein